VGILGGTPTSDSTVKPKPDLVNPDLVNLLTTAAADQQYSYVFGGSAQQLDHVLVANNLFPRVTRYAVARFDADFPEVYYGDGARPERLSDHDAPVAYFSFPTSDVQVRQSQAPSLVGAGSTITYTVLVENGSTDTAYGVSLLDTLPAGTMLASHVTPAGWTCTPVAEGLSCAAPAMAGGATASFTIVAQVACDAPNGADLANVAAIDSAMFDPNPGNNSHTLHATVSNPPPAIGGLLASPAVLWPVNHKMVPVAIDYTASDSCDAAPVCRLSVASSEQTDGRGDGRTATDWEVVGDHAVMLRAERSGTGNGRTYTVTTACTDRAGGETTKTVAVAVPKSQK
jgi:uncharacterized repeat protein (TIGR01451 family)